MSRNNDKEMGFVTKEGEDIDQGVYYLGLLVPPGRRCHVFYRDLSLTENSYTVQLITAANGFTGGTLGYQMNLNENTTEVVQSRVYGNVTPDGAETVLAEEMVEAGGSIGSAQRPQSVTAARFATTWTSSPMLKIIRHTTGSEAPYRIGLKCFVFERVAE